MWFWGYPSLGHMHLLLTSEKSGRSDRLVQFHVWYLDFGFQALELLEKSRCPHQAQPSRVETTCLLSEACLARVLRLGTFAVPVCHNLPAMQLCLILCVGGVEPAANSFQLYEWRTMP